MNPGKWGWIGVGIVVAVADGYALACDKTTMSDEFRRNFGWGSVIASGVFAHLLLHHQ